MKNKMGLSTILILVAIIITAILLIIALANKGEKIEDNSKDSGGLAQVIEQANDPALLTFNGKLQGFEGKQLGQYVTALYTYVESSNKDNPDKQVKITGIETADQIDTSKTYTVTFTKDQDGYYNSVNIEENKEN